MDDRATEEVRLTDNAEVWLICLRYEDQQADVDTSASTLGIKWDRAQRQFVFVGDEALVTPAARRFFDEVLRQSMEWLKPYLLEERQ
jgi:hypothetical protein